MSLRQLYRRAAPARGFSHSAAVLEEGRVPVPQAVRDQVAKHSVRRPIPAQVLLTGLKNWELERLRVVPTLKTFYGGNPVHEQHCDYLNGLIRKYCDLPTRPLDELGASYKFIGFEAYKKMAALGLRVKETHHSELTLLLARLRVIDPQLMPDDVKTALEKFSVKLNIFKQVEQFERTLDEYGRAYAVGKRKRAVAEVWLVRGNGQVLVNGVPLVQYFGGAAERKRVAYPFQVVSQEGQYNVFVKVAGGGTLAQAEAVMYGVAKGLVVFNPLLKLRLRKAGLMTRDARKVERKKPGRVKARKMPTWVKR